MNPHLRAPSTALLFLLALFAVGLACQGSETDGEEAVIPRTAVITSPENGAEFEQGTPIQFDARVSGFVPTDFSWSSSIDGLLVNRSMDFAMSEAALSVGTHLISFRASAWANPESIEVADTVQITVLPPEEEEADGEAATTTEPRFATEACACGGGIAIPLLADRGGPSNYSYLWSETYEIESSLACYWEEDYQSENLVGKIQASMAIWRLADSEQARLMFVGQRDEMAAAIPYCEEDRFCTAIPQAYDTDNEFGYIRDVVYVRPGDPPLQLPSSLTWNSVHLHEDGQGYRYVLKLHVSHPELDWSAADDWLQGVALQLQSCADGIINQRSD